MVANPSLDGGIIGANYGQCSSRNYPLSTVWIVFSSKEHNRGAKRWARTRSWSIVTIEWNYEAGQNKTIQDVGGRVTKLSGRHR